MVHFRRAASAPRQTAISFLSLGMVPTADTRIFFTITLLNADNAVIYRGRKWPGRSCCDSSIFCDYRVLVQGAAAMRFGQYVTGSTTLPCI